VIEKLVQLGASVDAFDVTGHDDAGRFTPLHAAASTGNVAAADALIRLGANSSIRDSKWSATAAGWARYFNHHAVRDVILAGPIDLFEALDFDLFDRIPQIVARDPSALERPFRAYADLAPRADQWWPQPDMTPLAWAIRTKKDEGARILRAMGAIDG
jgi:hypothetical protein